MMIHYSIFKGVQRSEHSDISRSHDFFGLLLSSVCRYNGFRAGLPLYGFIGVSEILRR
jgi:hypothetical protein